MCKVLYILLQYLYLSKLREGKLPTHQNVIKQQVDELSLVAFCKLFETHKSYQKIYKPISKFIVNKKYFRTGVNDMIKWQQQLHPPHLLVDFDMSTNKIWNCL